MFERILGYTVSPNFTDPKSFKEFLPSFKIPVVPFKRTWNVKHRSTFKLGYETIIQFGIFRDDGAACVVHFHIRNDKPCYWTVNDKETRYPNNLMKRLMGSVESELTNNSNLRRATISLARRKYILKSI